MNHNKCDQCLFYFIFSVKNILTLQICTCLQYNVYYITWEHVELFGMNLMST